MSDTTVATAPEPAPRKNRSSGGSAAAAGSALVGPLWFWGWLFTIGFAKLGFWTAVWALIVWPYYLGTAVR